MILCFAGHSLVPHREYVKSLGLYDESIYPPIENVPPKFAIAKRNEWMMTNADFIIVYVKYNRGGAFLKKRC